MVAENCKSTTFEEMLKMKNDFVNGKFLSSEIFCLVGRTPSRDHESSITLVGWDVPERFRVFAIFRQEKCFEVVL